MPRGRCNPDPRFGRRARSRRFRRLAADVEQATQIRTEVNLYAGWRRDNGFAVHWDPQDTFIVQVAGRKHWKVWPPTRLHPLKEEGLPIPEPTEDPLWDGILEDGDVLYLPRGWWHVAFPLDEPCLHLTVTIVPSQGIDLWNWLGREMLHHDELRMDLPHMASQEAQRAYLAKLRELIAEPWSDDLLERFFASRDARISPRPHLRLPHAPTQQNATITSETKVRLAASRQLSFEPADAGQPAYFRSQDSRWQCSRELVPALQTLNGSESIAFADLCAKLPNPAAPGKLKMILKMLAMAGIVWLESAAD